MDTTKTPDSSPATPTDPSPSTPDQPAQHGFPGRTFTCAQRPANRPPLNPVDAFTLAVAALLFLLGACRAFVQ